MIGKSIKRAAVAGIIVLAAIQFVQPERVNPPSAPESVVKLAPEASAVVRRACFDCHSNETVWPWYSHVAPVSWLVADDVREGRARLNLSEWNLLSPEVSKRRLAAMCREAKAGEMPLWQYRLLHPAAKLSTRDIAALCGAPPEP